MYKIAIFDLDGTILNTIEDLADSCNVICNKFGFPGHSLEEYKFFVGNGIPKLIERALPRNTSQEIQQKVLMEFIEYYQQHSAIKTAPYNGISELLQTMKAAGIRLAVNTNKTHKASVDLCNKYFPGIFDFICGNQTGIPTKPSPEGVFKILKELNFPLEEAGKDNVVFIGDSDVDIQTAENAGISSIGVDWGFRGEEFLKSHGAEVVVKSATELKAAMGL